MKMTKTLSALSLALAMLACSKDLPLVQEKSPEQEDAGYQLSLSADLDLVYDYDDDEARAARFTGENAPRIVLDDTDFQELYDSTRVNSTTSFRLNLMHMDVRNQQLNKGRMVFNLKNGQTAGIFRKPVELKVEKKGEQHSINLKVDMVDMQDALISPRNNSAWFGQIHIGGMPGQHPDGEGVVDGLYANYLKQYFCRSLENVRLNSPVQSRTEPNHEIPEVLPGAEHTQRRNFPLVGNLTPLTLTRKGDSPGVYNAQAHNNADMGLEERVHIRPRGTVFAITLSNSISEGIEVLSLMSPLNKGFDFEAYYDSNLCRPFPAGTDGNDLHLKTVSELKQIISPSGLIPPAVGYKSPEYANQGHRSFPLKGKHPSGKVQLEANSISAGRFFLWANVYEADKPLLLRVKYKYHDYDEPFQSAIISIRPPAGGFQEGKAYRLTLPILPPE